MTTSETSLDGLKMALASSARGYAAVIDGVLNIRTVSPSKNGAAMNAVYAQGYSLLGACQDPDCDCMVQKITAYFPGLKIVPVRVEETEDD